MQISGSLTFKNFLYYVGRAQDRMEELQVQSASGKQLIDPSDNPADARRALRLRHTLAQFDQYDRNIDRGIAMLDVAETNLADAGEIMIRLKEIAVVGANSSSSSITREGLADEVSQLRDQLIKLSNADFDGQYVFSGTATQAPAFSGVGTYDGNTGSVQITIGQGLTVPVTKRGDAVFGTASGGVDIFASVNALETALRADDVTAIQNQIDVLESGRSQLVATRAGLGAITNRLEGTKSSLDNLRVTLAGHLSKIEDADLVEVITALQSTQNILDATIASYGTTANASLLDFLR